MADCGCFTALTSLELLHEDRQTVHDDRKNKALGRSSGAYVEPGDRWKDAGDWRSPAVMTEKQSLDDT